jgi:predicted MPP superfamily phosphohydrolase
MHNLEPILVVPDTHVPFHDVKAWDLMMDVAHVLNPYHVIIIGDLADFYSVSSHSKDPSRVSKLSDEVKAVNHVLDELDDLGAQNKQYIAGNHEDRLTRYLAEKAPELFGIVGIPELLELEERGWGYTPYKSHYKLGKLHFTHDVGAFGRNATFKALDTYQHSVVTGHAHRLQYIVEGNAVGEHKVSAQFGWLGDTSKVDYMQQVNVNKNWALGFGAGYFNPSTGIGYLTPVPIVNYTCVWNGELFER